MPVFSTSGELIGLLSGEVADLSEIQYKTAVNRALVETGFSIPPGSDFQEYWLYTRGIRHCVESKVLSTADKFRVKNYHLGQKFDHWFKLIVKMDETFEEAIAENPAEFAGVDGNKMFGTVITPGFSYDDLGRDTTYTDENEVLIFPDEDD